MIINIVIKSILLDLNRMTDIETTELSRIDRLSDAINKIINTDGKVTEEEETLFQNILENLSHYRILLMDIAADNIIDDKEKQQMAKFKQNIMGNAQLIAMEDEKFSEDELNILKELKKFKINSDY